MLTQEFLFFIVKRIEVIVFKLSFENTHFTKVKSHVCSQNGTNHLFTGSLVVVGCEVLKDIVVILIKKLKSCGYMKILQYTNIVVPESNSVFLLDQVNVVESRMTDVVACSRKDIAHHIPLV